MSRRRSTRLKPVPVPHKPKFNWLRDKKRRRKAPATNPNPTISPHEELRANEELVAEARDVSLVSQLVMTNMVIAHKVATQVIEVYPHVVVRDSQTRLEAAILFTRRKLTRNDRHFKKEIEEGVKVAEGALAIARLAIEARARQARLVGAHPR